MILVVLIAAGLITGSFLNALVWRLHKAPKLSVWKGRSICPRCEHSLTAVDLVPVVSWLLLRGKCRYCHKPISWQYPLVELAVPLLFVLSYLWWPYGFEASGMIRFVGWLVFVAGFVALAVYDLRWQLLPHKIVFPLTILAGLQWLVIFALDGQAPVTLLDLGLSVLIAGGFFYGLFQLSQGQWIGGGDVKLGFLLGLVLATPLASLQMLFLASLLGTVVSVPLLLRGQANRKTRVPFGPFLLAAAWVVMLFGQQFVV